MCHISVETRQADLAAGSHAQANNAELHHAQLVLVQVEGGRLQRATRVALAGVLQIAAAHTELTGGHLAAIGLGASRTALNRHFGLEQYIRGGTVLGGAPAGDKVVGQRLSLLLQLIAYGQADGLNVLCKK